jgi:hypothetical protein
MKQTNWICLPPTPHSKSRKFSDHCSLSVYLWISSSPDSRHIALSNPLKNNNSKWLNVCLLVEYDTRLITVVWIPGGSWNFIPVTIVFRPPQRSSFSLLSNTYHRDTPRASSGRNSKMIIRLPQTSRSRMCILLPHHSTWDSVLKNSFTFYAGLVYSNFKLIFRHLICAISYKIPTVGWGDPYGFIYKYI